MHGQQNIKFCFTLITAKNHTFRNRQIHSPEVICLYEDSSSKGKTARQCGLMAFFTVLKNKQNVIIYTMCSKTSNNETNNNTTWKFEIHGIWVVLQRGCHASWSTDDHDKHQLFQSTLYKDWGLSVLQRQLYCFKESAGGETSTIMHKYQTTLLHVELAYRQGRW
jgi:hypothetical protein